MLDLAFEDTVLVAKGPCSGQCRSVIQSFVTDLRCLLGVVDRLWPGPLATVASETT